MLIGEAGDIQSVCPCSFRHAHPIHAHLDVRVTNSLERRIQMSMLRADLNACIKFIAQMPVIDREDIAASQFRRNAVDPIECSLIKGRLSSRRLAMGLVRPIGGLESCRFLGNGALDKHKPVAIEIDKFFFTVANQTNRHGIEQLVGKMDPDKWIE